MIIQMRGPGNGLLKLIEKLPFGIVMAEIGCYAGESTAMFLNSGKIDMLYAIDPWKGGYSETDLASRSNMKVIEGNFDARTKKFLNCEKMKGTFQDAFDDLPDLDAVYIDGDHHYEFVLSDIQLSIEKVKNGGIISGHDYRIKNGVDNAIVRAVKETFGKAEIFPDTSWMVINKK